MPDLSVSVAMATFNGASFLREQLADLSAQSRPPDELVICDDVSSDETVTIAEEFAASAPFTVRIHRNPVRLGYRQNFVQCAGRCNSDLVAFCDQDDRWAIGKLQTVATCFDDPAILMVFHNARVVGDDGSFIANLHESSVVRRWAPLNGPPWSFSPGFTQVFRKELLDFNDLWEKSQDENADGERLAHDRWYYFLASTLGAVEYLPDCLADYRQHRSNTYGWARFMPSIGNRIADRAIDAGHNIRRRGQAAKCRGEILEEVAARVGEPSTARAIAGADAYRKLAERTLLRAAIYERTSLAKRATAFGKLIRAGAYGSDPWQIGPLGMAMDATVGIGGLQRNSGKPSAARVNAAEPGKIA